MALPDQMRPGERASQILEERNSAYRILYNTVMEVEGASAEKTYRILCTNLMKICNADFAALAVFDNETSALTLEAVDCKKKQQDKPCDEFKPITHVLTPDCVDYLKTIQVRLCIEHNMCVASFFHQCLGDFINTIEGKCYQMSCVREGELIAAGMVIIKEKKLRMKDIVDTFLNLAGIIIERAISTAKLSESRENYKNLVTNINDIIYIRDTHGKILYINDAVREILGFEPTDIIHDTYFYETIYNNPVNVAAKRAIDDEQIGVQPAKPFECEICGKNGRTVILEVQDKLIFEDGKIKKIQGICRDITNRKRTEKLLIEKNRELNEFTKIVSHDLKAPLGAMKSFLNNIRNDPSLFELLFDNVIKQTDKLLSFIDSLLKLCRAGKVISDKIDISVKLMIENCMANLTSPEIETELHIQPNLPAIYGDYISLSQVFSNLISNSMRYRDQSKDKVVISIEGTSEPGYSEIVYKDNGSGIDSNFIHKVFDSGYTAGKAGGTGFGLAIVKKVIEAHNGEIRVESEGIGKGTTFLLKIPSEIPSCQIYQRSR
jgi:PAS domain S-box-containing protein